MADISNGANWINVSDLTERVDELRAERAEHDKQNGTTRDADGELTGESAPDENDMLRANVWEAECADDAEELANILALLEQLDGQGSGHEWDGNRYPQELIAEHHFSQFVQNQAEECGDISRSAAYIVVDWDATANAVRQDYRTVDYDGSEYLHRC